MFPDMDMPPSSTFKLPSSAFDPPRDDWHASGVRADRERSFAAIMERRQELSRIRQPSARTPADLRALLEEANSVPRR